jgi:hypothetical protein
MSLHPAIVVVAYNRTASLLRLLGSLQKARYTVANVDLVISIDYSGSNDVYLLAEKFEWLHGNKKIISRETNLGLKKHILQCGDLAEQYGSVIILEDDLMVSPFFYEYALAAGNFYKNDLNVAGISLFNYQIAENNFFPFKPVEDGSDVYFIQVASSWGQLVTYERWKEFRAWLAENDKPALPEYAPQYLLGWSATSWKKYFIQYLIEANKYFVFPRVGLSTNFGEEGTNTDRRGLFQTPLLQGEKTFRFKALADSRAVYDAWFEITPAALSKLCPQLAAYNYTVDLHGTKNTAVLPDGLLLSSKTCYAPVLSFANDLSGAEQNVIENLPGSFYHLADTKVFKHDSDPDFSVYYTELNSIRDLVFKSYLEKIKNNPPLQVIVVHQNEADNIKGTLHSIYKQNYPASQLTIKVLSAVQYMPELQEGYQVEVISYAGNSNLSDLIRRELSKGFASYQVILNSGDVFFDQAFNAVNRIFKNYPDIKWVTGIETPQTTNGFSYMYGSTAVRRWNKHIFKSVLHNNTSRRLPAAATFWRRELWDVAKNHPHAEEGRSIFDNLFLSFFDAAPLYTCEVYLSTSPQHDFGKFNTQPLTVNYSFAEAGLFSRMWEFFFINNIPYLRSVYKQKNELKPVVRFDHYLQCYFLCDY